jgi:hypothetical protein
MRVQKGETSGSVVAFAPKKGPPDATMVADDAGEHIVALVQQASDMAKADCQRAMDLAQHVSSQLLSFKVVRLEQAGQEVLARATNIVVAKAAFDMCVSLYQYAEIELRQASRVICSSKGR